MLPNSDSYNLRNYFGGGNENQLSKTFFASLLVVIFGAGGLSETLLTIATGRLPEGRRAASCRSRRSRRACSDIRELNEAARFWRIATGGGLVGREAQWQEHRHHCQLSERVRCGHGQGTG